MRYINLFERFSRVSTTNCFPYNNILFFAVPKNKVSQAIGKNGETSKRLGAVLGKKIKIIKMPEGDKNLKSFVKNLVEPLEFTSLEVNGDELKICATMQNRAMLIGRDRAREKELLEILDKIFGIKKLNICQ